MFPAIVFLLLALSAACAQTPRQSDIERRVRSEMDFLASDEMQGRGSATEFEAVAARYLASELERDGLLPGGDATPSGNSYLQNLSLTETRVASATLKLGTNTAELGSGFV